jgi:hypothetical protein
MKKLVLSFLLVPLLLPGTVFSQSNGHGKSTAPKASTISGTVSQDGRGLIGKNGEPWVVANPATLTGHEGQQVKVKCQLSSGGHDIHVLSVKTAATQTKYAVNLGDAAFRR